MQQSNKDKLSPSAVNIYAFVKEKKTPLLS